MSYPEIREKVIEYSLMCQKSGLIRGTSGNISIRSDDGKVIAISPTSIPYEKLTAQDIPLVDENCNIVEGSTKPSSEMPMHTAVLRARPDLNAVIHTHSKWATILSVIGQELPIITIPMVALAPSPAPIVPFEIPGSPELGEAIVKGLGKTGYAVLMENHGLLVAGPSIEVAMMLTDYIDEAAEIAFYCNLGGNCKGIATENVMKLVEILKSGRAL